MEVATFCGNFKFPGQGQKTQPVITLKGALKLIEWLPGENAKNYRGQAVEILTRYLAGDASMHKELEANAAFTSPINVLASESVGSKPGAAVRVLMEQPPLLCAVDAAMVVTGKDQNHAGEAIRRI